MAYSGYDDAWVLGRNRGQSQSHHGNPRSSHGSSNYRHETHHGEHSPGHHYDQHHHGDPVSHCHPTHHLEHSTSHGHERYHDHHERSRSWSHSRPEHYTQGDRHRVPEYARLAWPTEIPVKLSMWVCCDECKATVYGDLKHLEGVYDVGISGWSYALVTVTGTASASKILERARTVSNHAELWSDNNHPGNSHQPTNRRHP